MRFVVVIALQISLWFGVVAQVVFAQQRPRKVEPGIVESEKKES